MKEIEVTCKLGKELTADEIQTAAVKALGVSPKVKNQLKYRIMRRSIDARNDILYRYRVEVYKPDEVMPEYVLEEYKDVSSAEPVIIVGAGPAGMFAALRLLIAGETVNLRITDAELYRQLAHATYDFITGYNERNPDVAFYGTYSVVSSDAQRCVIIQRTE